MNVILQRTEQDQDGMFGELLIDGEQYCLTVERPWKDNKNGVSCIPPGTYHVTRFKSPANGDCFLLHDVPGRDMIEIHAANVSSQLKGCIAPGRSFANFSEFGDVRGVTSSKLTLLGLMGKLPQEFDITINNPGD